MIKMKMLSLSFESLKKNDKVKKTFWIKKKGNEIIKIELKNKQILNAVSFKQCI